MITLIRMIRLWQLKVKWQLAIMQFIDKQATELAKHPENIEKKILPYLTNLVHDLAMLEKTENDK